MPWGISDGDVVNSAYLKTLLEGALGGGKPAQPASYTIFLDGSTFKARNGTTGIIDHSGTDAATVIQAALNALTSGDCVLLKEATYTINSQLRIPSNVTFMGSGRGTILKPSATIATLTFDDQTGLLATVRNKLVNDTDITIRDLAIDCTDKDAAGMHAIHIHQASRVQILNVYVTEGGDSVAFTESTNYLVQGCKFENFLGAGVDQWQSCKRGKVIGNDFIGQGATSDNGILCTGLTSADVATTTEEIIIMGNNIYNINNNAIWLQGGLVSGGGSAGVCKDCIVIGNNIDTIIEFHGIRVSDGSGHIIANNIINNVQLYGIVLQREYASGTQTDCIIQGNETRDTNGVGTAEGAITLHAGSNNNVIDGNRVHGSPIGQYALYIASGAIGNAVGYGNKFSQGSLGYASILDASTRLPSLTVPFAHGFDDNDSGWLVDAATEYARTWFNLPADLKEVLAVEIWARTSVTEADAMQLELVMYGAMDNEAYMTHNTSKQGWSSTSTNFAADDVIYWRLTKSEVAALANLQGGDNILLKVLHEDAGNGNCATAAYFRNVIVYYV